MVFTFRNHKIEGKNLSDSAGNVDCSHQTVKNVIPIKLRVTLIKNRTAIEVGDTILYHYRQSDIGWEASLVLSSFWWSCAWIILLFSDNWQHRFISNEFEGRFTNTS